MASKKSPDDVFGGRGSPASTRSPAEYSIAEVAQLQCNGEDRLFQPSEYAPEEDTPAGIYPRNEADSGMKPLAQPLQTGTAELNSVASFRPSALEPTPVREIPASFNKSNQIGQELDSSNTTNRHGVFTNSSQILPDRTAPNTGSNVQPQGLVALGWTGLVPPRVNFASNASYQWPFAGSGGVHNQILAVQQQNLALLQMLHHGVFMPPHGASLGTAMLFPSAPLAPGVANSNPQAAMTLPSSDSGQSAPLRTTTAVLHGVEGTEKLQGGYTGERKPKRALTAYNIFFRDERVRLLQGSEMDDYQAGGEEIDGSNKTENNSGKKRRRRQKAPAGKKIGFEEMGKIIGKNWKQIDPERHSYYVKQAAEETKRYKSELAIYNQRQVRLIEAERLRREATEDGSATAKN